MKLNLPEEQKSKILEFLSKMANNPAEMEKFFDSISRHLEDGSVLLAKLADDVQGIKKYIQLTVGFAKRLGADGRDVVDFLKKYL